MNTLALHFVKSHESFRQFVYDDATGKPLGPGDTIQGNPTVGYGLNLVARGTTEEDAALLTTRYLVELERGLKLARPVFGTLSLTRQAALLDMAYQMGLGGLLGFKRMWAAIEAGDWRRAYDECLDSEYGRRFATRATKNARILVEDRLGKA